LISVVVLRVVSCGLAAVASVIGLVFPFLLARHPTGLNQCILMVLMAGIAGAFIYGAGFSSKNPWLRLLISPLVTWPPLLGSLLLLFVLR